MAYRTHSDPYSWSDRQRFDQPDRQQSDQSDRQQIRIVVHCVYEKDLSHSKTWAMAVTEIYQEANMLCEQGMEIGVELFDFDYVDTSHFISGPSEKSRELSMNWNKGHNYRQNILQLFENRPQMWQAMMPIGLYAKGERSEDHKMVIYFDALDAEDDAWDELEEAIRSILPEDVGVAIQQNTGPLFCNDDSVSKPEFSADNYIRPPRPGCEISIANDLASGTLGGYIMTEAKDTRRRTTFGITNAHVVFGSKFRPNCGLRCVCQTCYRAPGCYLLWQASDSIVIQSPGEETRRKNENELRTTVTDLESHILKQTKIIEAVKESDHALAQRLDRRLKPKQSTSSKLKEFLQLAERDASIGSVQVARFGYRHYATPSSGSSDLMMDLALIRMGCLLGKHPQEIFLKANEKNPKILDNTTYNSWEVDGLDMDAEKQINVVAKLSPDGRYTMGYMTKFEADIKFPIYLKNGVKTVPKRSAWVVSTPILPGINYRTLPSDSGSLIIAASGWKLDGRDNKVAMPKMSNDCAEKPFVVSLLFGSSDRGGVTYFIPFDAVKSEIESLTGEEMVWPPKRSSCMQRWEEGYDDLDEQ